MLRKVYHHSQWSSLQSVERERPGKQARVLISDCGCIICGFRIFCFFEVIYGRLLVVKASEYFPEDGSYPGRDFFPDLKFLAFHLQKDPVKSLLCQEVIKISGHGFEPCKTTGHAVGQIVPFDGESLPRLTG